MINQNNKILEYTTNFKEYYDTKQSALNYVAGGLILSVALAGMAYIAISHGQIKGLQPSLINSITIPASLGITMAAITLVGTAFYYVKKTTKAHALSHELYLLEVLKDPAFDQLIKNKSIQAEWVEFIQKVDNGDWQFFLNFIDDQLFKPPFGMKVDESLQEAVLTRLMIEDKPNFTKQAHSYLMQKTKKSYVASDAFYKTVSTLIPQLLNCRMLVNS